VELTLDSALSLGGWVGHLSYFLLVLSMLMRHIGALRILAILSAVAGITYDYVWLMDPIGVFWESLLLSVNVGQLGLMHFESRRATFSDEEKNLLQRVLPDLSGRLQRKLMDAGVWTTGEPGTVLTREDQAVNDLAYLASGEALITVGGIGVAACHAGAFVGEMTVLTQEPATGTAILSKPSRYWSIDARVLRQLTQAEPEIRSALGASFAKNLREKLVASNQAALEALRGRL
jgi:CRP-like cAMP-binding protein